MVVGCGRGTSRTDGGVSVFALPGIITGLEYAALFVYLIHCEFNSMEI